MPEFKKYKAEHNGLVFRIEEDLPEVGAYLYVYENDVCVNDYLQNDVNGCIDFAFTSFKVPANAWVITG